MILFYLCNFLTRKLSLTWSNLFLYDCISLSHLCGGILVKFIYVCFSEGPTTAVDLGQGLDFDLVIPKLYSFIFSHSDVELLLCFGPFAWPHFDQSSTVRQVVSYLPLEYLYESLLST